MISLVDALPRVHLLDPRPAEIARAHPIANSVNIPVTELARSLSELPPPAEILRVADVPEAQDQVFESLGRPVVRAPFEFGPAGPGRLWEPSELAIELVQSGDLGRILDIGAGTGRDAVYLAANGGRVVALDHARDFISRGSGFAPRYLPPTADLEWVWGDASQFNLHGAFDAVLMVRFLDKSVVRRAWEVVRVGGSMLIQCFHPSERLRRGQPKSLDLVASPEELSELLPDGFQVTMAEVRTRDDRAFTFFRALKA